MKDSGGNVKLQGCRTKRTLLVSPRPLRPSPKIACLQGRGGSLLPRTDDLQLRQFRVDHSYLFEKMRSCLDLRDSPSLVLPGRANTRRLDTRTRARPLSSISRIASRICRAARRVEKVSRGRPLPGGASQSRCRLHGQLATNLPSSSRLN